MAMYGDCLDANADIDVLKHSLSLPCLAVPCSILEPMLWFAPLALAVMAASSPENSTQGKSLRGATTFHDCAGVTAQTAPQIRASCCWACIYEHTRWRGQYMVIGAGQTVSNLPGLLHREISLKIAGDCVAELWAYGNQILEMYTDSADPWPWAAGGISISSIKVRERYAPIGQWVYVHSSNDELSTNMQVSMTYTDSSGRDVTNHKGTDYQCGGRPVVRRYWGALDIDVIIRRQICGNHD